MKRLAFLSCALLLITACSSSGRRAVTLQDGNSVPDFTLPDQKGERVTLSNVLTTHRGAVIAFYPKDDSSN
jgi:major membrane immunogen (membrane-anchored lipoprotein)